MTAGRSRDVAVVICAYTEERWEALLDAVESAQSQTHAPSEVVVVVDHNARLLQRLAAKTNSFRVVANLGERGLASARNTGVAASASEIVAFLDDDAIAAPDWLECLVAHYDDPTVIGVGGSIEALWEEQRPRGFPAEFDWVVGCSYRGMPEAATTVRNLIGANMSFRRDMVLRAGGFRSDMGRVGTRPLGCEETEFCIRATAAVPNSKILYEPAARVLHRVPPERARWSYFRARCYAEGRSKAIVARRVGAAAGLASERTHALRELPLAVLRGIGDALRGDMYGAVRAAAVLVGLTITSAGLIAGTVAPARASTA